MKFLIFSTIVLFLSGQISAQKLTADLIILDGKIRTMDKKIPRAEAVAIVGNKIFAVGTNKKIRAFAGAKTKTIEAKGRLVLPGFNDAHVHFFGIGNLFSSIDLRGVKTTSEIAERIEFQAKFIPKNRWILGSGLNQENLTPNNLLTKELIDKIVPENPVLIYNFDARTALVNSLALRIAGVNKNTKNPAGGEVVRDEDGNPTGILKGAAISLVRKYAPLSLTQNKLAVAEAATNYAAYLGVTSVQDMHSDYETDVYRELERQGKLKTRIYDCSPLPEWEKLARGGVRRASGNAMIRNGCLKFFSDGDATVAPQLFNEIQAADKADLQVMIHAIGEQANDVVLGVFERIIKENGAKDRRFRIEHAHNFRLQDSGRFGRSKIIASMQPHLFYGGEPYRALLASGTTLAFGSDASITDFNPLLGISAAVGGNFENPSQTISVEEAVSAYTVGSAFAEFQEDIKGTITAGKLADLVILSGDIFAINPSEIKNTKVLLTVVDGKIVYQQSL